MIALERRAQGAWPSDRVIEAMEKLTDDEAAFAVAIHEDRFVGSLVGIIGSRFGRYWEADRA